MKVLSEELLDEISDDLNQFLQYGNLTSFAKDIDPNLNIDNINKLLRIHFVLTQSTDKGQVGVLDFVEELSQRLRRIKTTIKKEIEIFEGEVRGRINWKNTINQRYKHNLNDTTLFACEKKEKDYDIAENLVLKRLLQIIHEIIFYDLSIGFRKKYNWLKKWVDGAELREVLNKLYFRNVYLKRINLAKSYVTDRMINRAKKSRNILYREAAYLLERYNKLMAYELDPSEAKELLKNTFIAPEKADVLFELYWTIKIINQFENPKFYLIEPGSNIVASWDAHGFKYRIFHNSVGSFEFKEKLDEVAKQQIDKDNFLGREIRVLKTLEQLTGFKTDSLWGGRTDIVLEKVDETGQIISILIGEVKYTQDKDYAVQGLKELLEYMALIKHKGKYFDEYKKLFKDSGNITGCLFLDFIDDFKINKTDDLSIHCIMYGDKANNLMQMPNFFNML
jgi:hypothetical protein